MLQGIRWLPAAVRMEFFPLCFAQLTRCIRESTQAALGGAGGWRPWQKTSLGEIIWEMVWCAMNNPIIIWLYHFCFILRFCIPGLYISVSHMMRLGVYSGIRWPGLQLWPTEYSLSDCGKPCPLRPSVSSSVESQFYQASHETAELNMLHKSQMSAAQM